MEKWTKCKHWSYITIEILVFEMHSLIMLSFIEAENGLWSIGFFVLKHFDVKLLHSCFRPRTEKKKTSFSRNTVKTPIKRPCVKGHIVRKNKTALRLLNFAQKLLSLNISLSQNS